MHSILFNFLIMLLPKHPFAENIEISPNFKLTRQFQLSVARFLPRKKIKTIWCCLPWPLLAIWPCARSMLSDNNDMAMVILMMIMTWCIDDDDEDDLLTPINHMTPHERAGCPKPFVPIGRLPFRYLIPHIRSCQSKIPRSTQIGHFVSTWLLLNEWSFVFVEGSQKYSAHARLRILKRRGTKL